VCLIGSLLAAVFACIPLFAVSDACNACATTDKASGLTKAQGAQPIYYVVLPYST